MIKAFILKHKWLVAVAATAIIATIFIVFNLQPFITIFNVITAVCTTLYEWSWDIAPRSFLFVNVEILCFLMYWSIGFAVIFVILLIRKLFHWYLWK